MAGRGRLIRIYTEDLSTEVATRDDGGCASSNYHTRLTYTLDPGDYVVVVEGYQTSQGAFTLNVTCSAPSPYRGTYRGPLVCGEGVSGSTAPEFDGTFASAINHHTYTFNVTDETPRPISIDACESEFDTVLTIMDVGTGWNLTNDDAQCTASVSGSAIRSQCVPRFFARLFFCPTHWCAGLALFQLLTATNPPNSTASFFRHSHAPSNPPLHLTLHSLCRNLPNGNYTVVIQGYNFATGIYHIALTCGNHTVAPTTAPVAVAGVPTSAAPTVAPGNGNTHTPSSRHSRAPTRVTRPPTSVRSASPTAAGAGVSTSSGGGGGGGATVTAVVVVLLLLVVVGGLLYWRHTRTSLSRSFSKMSHNPNFAPNRLLDYEEDDDGDEVDVFARKRRGRTPTLSDDW